MITMCFSLLMIAVFGRLFFIALRVTWGIVMVIGLISLFQSSEQKA